MSFLHLSAECCRLLAHIRCRIKMFSVQTRKQDVQLSPKELGQELIINVWHLEVEEQPLLIMFYCTIIKGTYTSGFDECHLYICTWGRISTTCIFVFVRKIHLTASFWLSASLRSWAAKCNGDSLTIITIVATFIIQATFKAQFKLK